MRTYVRERWHVRAAMVSLSFVAALAGCGSSAAKPNTPLNTVTLERAIAGSILTERHVYTLVSCPAEPQQSGLMFTCKAMLKIGAYPIVVTETDGKGHVRYGSQASLVALDTDRVARAIEASVLAQRALHTRVVCPSDVLQQKGLAFTCTAKVGGKSYPFDVTEVDGDGHVRYVGR